MTSQPGNRLSTLASIAASCLLLIPATSAAVTVTATQSPATVRPGQPTVILLTIDLTSLTQATLKQLRLTNRTTGPGTQAQLDAELGSLRLYEDAVVIGDGMDVAAAPSAGRSPASSGTVTFSGLNIVIPALGTPKRLFVVADIPLAVRDGDALDLSIKAASDLSFDFTNSATGSFPIEPAGNFPIDGMSAAQLLVTPAPADSIIAGTVDNLVLDVILPSNGYQSDVLRDLTVVNEGTAQAGTDVGALRAWADNGDGQWKASQDRSLGALAFTGSQWSLTGLTEAVPTSGLRMFVSADVGDLAVQGRTIRLMIPAAPGEGIAMLSSNDGPLDAVVRNPSFRAISISDRISFVAVPSGPVTARPGDRGVMLLHLRATNTYAVSRTLGSLTVTNLSNGPGSQSELDRETALLTLRADGNGNGILDGTAVDPVLGTAIFSSRHAEFAGLSWALAPGESRHLFVTADLSVTDAADGDTLAAVVASALDADFGGPTRVVASWPLDSGRRCGVDGMVSAQVLNLGAPGVSLAPGEGPALALDLVLPRNGYLDDVLQGLTIVNHGDAVASDLAQLRLWRDGGDGVYSAGAGDDRNLGVLAPAGPTWVWGALSDTIRSGGARYFVGVTISAAPRDSATIRLALPLGGVAMRSGNDGPLDAPVENPNVQLVSNSPLLATLGFTAAASTVGQTVRARMLVRNRGAVTLAGVAPSALVQSGSGALSPVSGPSPASLTLAPAAVDSFEWVFTAGAPGDVSVTGSAHGNESPGGALRRSLDFTSSPHHVTIGVARIDFTATPSLPNTVNRGEQGVAALGLTLSNFGGPNGSRGRLLGLRIRLEDENGIGIVPASLLSQVVVAQGTTTHLAKTALESAGADVDLPLTTPVVVAPGTSVALSLRLDIDPSTPATSLRVVIGDSTVFTADDAVSGAAIALRLQGSAYPIRTAAARVVESPTRLDVSANGTGTARVGRGQSEVPLVTLRLSSPGSSGVTSDVQITALAIGATDGAGAPLPRLADVLSRVRVHTALQNLTDRIVYPTDGGTLTLALSPPLSVPVNTPLDLFVTGDILANAHLGVFRARLEPPVTFDARDERSGNPIPVFYASDPIEGDSIVVESAADSLRARSTARFPQKLTIGSLDVPAMTAVLRHPDGAGAARIRTDTLRVQCRDQSRQPLDPADYLDRIRVRWNGAPLAAQPVAASGGEIAVRLPGPTLEPGDSAVVEVWVDLSATAPEGSLELASFGADLRAVDANLGTPVTVTPEAGAELPLLSGLADLVPPSRDLEAGLTSAMPAALAADGDTIVAGVLRLANVASASSDSISVTHLVLVASDRTHAPLAIGRAASRLLAYAGGALWSQSAPLSPDSAQATLESGAPLAIAAGVTVPIELRAVLHAAGTPSPKSFRVGCDGSGIGVVQPASAVLRIQVRPAAGQSFPLWTEAGTFGSTRLSGSYSNFPNPFAAGRKTTTFAYYLERTARVTLRIMTPHSEPVATVVRDRPRPAGMNQSDAWDGRNGNGDVVRNGVYVVELSVAYDDGTHERLLRKVAVVR